MAEKKPEKEPEEKPEENTDAVQLTQVATQTAPAVILPDGRTVGIEEYLVWLGNLVYEIKKNTG